MLCHIACRVEYPDTFIDIRATLPCESPLGVGGVQGLLTQLFPKAIQFKNLQIHNDQTDPR